MPPVPDAEIVLRWCRAGLDALAAAREEIDALNVYPVPDGDTGTNLYLTFEAAEQAARETAQQAGEQAGEPTLAATAEAMARGALLGARGNSGIIVAQMLRGVADVLSRPGVTLADGSALAHGLTRAAEEAHRAVADPVEGTILTVARAAADAARHRATQPGSSLPAVALAAAAAAHEALDRTPAQLDVLARAGVVDAGGRGLTVLLDAFDTVLTGRRALPRPRTVGTHTVPAPAIPVPERAAGGPAYEVMYLLDAPQQAVDALKQNLATLGDSLVVSGAGEQWNVHVHTDDAGAAIEAGIGAGRPHRISVTYLPVQHRPPEEAHQRVVVAFAAGDGLAELFAEAGAVVVATATGHRPSTGEMLAAVDRGDARRTGDVVILPNERDAVPVAEAAAAELRTHGRRAAVIPTVAQVQGLAALAVHEPNRAFDADVVAMTAAAGQTRHGAVTIAARQAVTMAGVCQPGDVLGVVDGDFAVIGADLLDVASEVVARMLAAGGELVTVVTGDGADPGLADGVARAVRRGHPEADTVVYRGGQPRYPLLLGVE
ncbi:DAK2 domain-containing protein [Jiangella ureilytica]|uniref:DAK2 domain-containing protein n=1 Tax=Jiangella ureilytica TaxID=2530374 RepID=A0A4R4S4X8_9ACTN|nr:DAK2 domain-containing protein [Jiangella ureilytica]TDC56899.1 DAK2 domain-containing protein [Jiangella ureilytica]